MALGSYCWEPSWGAGWRCGIDRLMRVLVTGGTGFSADVVCRLWRRLVGSTHLRQDAVFRARLQASTSSLPTSVSQGHLRGFPPSMQWSTRRPCHHLGAARRILTRQTLLRRATCLNGWSRQVCSA